MKSTPISNKLNIVILAAGAGKRMQSTLPKVLHTLAGYPLLRHVINTARLLFPNKICIVIGHGGGMVREAIPDDDLIWITQAAGTGHAVMQALPQLDKAEQTLVLSGIPLINIVTLKN
jgi:bifunctional UDP-N-acetylglucosamine pyrophosphorylase/glucosamine-1-phosphate N-acetyltransferase